MISVARVIAPFIANDNSFSRVLSHIIYIYQLLEILSKLAEQNLNKKREHTFSPAYFAIVKLRKYASSRLNGLLIASLGIHLI